MEENLIKVYVSVNKDNIVTGINSSIFIQDVSDWVEIDSGNGDKYAHAQSNYLEKGLIDQSSNYNYKLDNGNLVELTEEEKKILFPTPTPVPTEEEILRAKLIQDNANMQLQLTQQQQINANLLSQIAKLGGTQ